MRGAEPDRPAECWPIMDMSRSIPVHGGVAEPDLAVACAVAPYRGSTAVKAIDAIGRLGHAPPLLGAAGLALAWALVRGDPRLARQSAHIVAAIGTAAVLKVAVKWTVVRTRPKLLIEEGRHEVGLFGANTKQWNSMPSGHAAASAAAAQACANCWPETRAAAFAAAALLSLARVPPAKHYPSDILVGFGLGIAAARIVKRIFPPPAGQASTESRRRRRGEN
jgi:membrane-associated phospholipid phosphatase